MHTEDEARRLWCPIVRAITMDDDGNTGLVSFNRQCVINTSRANIPHATGCLASGCSMWRWADADERIEYDEVFPNRPAGEINPPFSNCPDGYGVISYGSNLQYHARREISRLARRGYCGLAGDP